MQKISSGTLTEGQVPQVVFYKPAAELNEHPGYANVLEGDEHLGRVLCMIEQSPIWSKSIVIVTFDENGGYWDHVPPPVIDRWGPSTRVPTVIISPFAKKGFIDHTTYDSTAILKLIEIALRARVFGRPRQEVKGPDQRLRLRRPSARAGLQTLEVRRRQELTTAAASPEATSSVKTLKAASVWRPYDVVIATSVASRPRAIRMRPMRGVLWRASNVYQRSPR